MPNGKEAQKELNLRIRELVEKGCLCEKDGINKLHKQILKEFRGCKFGKRSLDQKIFNLLWKQSKSIDDSLKQIVQNNPDASREDLLEILNKDFCSLYPYIPIEMAEKRARWHHGITKNRRGRKINKILPGIGRITFDLPPETLKKFKMPVATFENPFKINAKDPDNWSIMFLNGSNIGTRHGGAIVDNVSRRALSDASFRGDIAVFATNMLVLDTKKAAGPSKTKKALVFAGGFSTDAIKDIAYEKIAGEIIAEQPMDEVLYTTTEERIDNILKGWTKISLKPDNKPEYKGPVYIVLGNNEKDIIFSIAYWEMAWWTRVKQDELRGELSRLKRARLAAEKREDHELAKTLQEKYNVIRSQDQRSKISFIDTREWHRFYRYAKAAVIQRIERAIPNSKVIGQDTSYVEISGHKIEVNIPGHNEVTDTLLANYSRKYGSKNLQERIAPTVVICHPWSLNFRMTDREVDYDGQRGSTEIFVAPIAVDETYLKETLDASAAQSHPFAKTIFSEGFKAGVLRLNCVSGLINPDNMSIDSLESFKDYPQIRRENKHSIYHRGPKYVWVEISSDPHWGSRAKEFITCNIPSSERTGLRLGMTEAVSEMMRDGGLCRNGNMRVHIFVTPDDQSQGQHFPARTQPHPHQLSIQDIETQSNEMLQQIIAAKDKSSSDEIAKRMNRFLGYQFEVRGSDFPLDQVLQVMERSLDANLDVFREILKSADRAGIIIRGVGEFGNAQHGGYDTRNCGIINLGSGNHFEKTTKGELVEGPLYAKHLIASLAQYPEWRGKDKLLELEKRVVAPLYSGEFIGWGILQTPTGYEYGLDIRATPAQMAGWGDTLLGATRNMPQRGNYARIFNNRLPVVCIYGDKHFFGTAITDCAIHHMCASGTHTDRFGELGFPPNNTGVSFLGLPTDGPDKGPVLVRILPFDVIEDFVEDNPRPFDWENFLPNPV